MSWGLVTPIPTLAPATASFVDAWLEDDSGPLPCWQGIQFGQTTVTETIGILNDLPEISLFAAIPIMEFTHQESAQFQAEHT